MRGKMTDQDYQNQQNLALERANEIRFAYARGYSDALEKSKKDKDRIIKSYDDQVHELMQDKNVWHNAYRAMKEELHLRTKELKELTKKMERMKK